MFVTDGPTVRAVRPIISVRIQNVSSVWFYINRAVTSSRGIGNRNTFVLIVIIAGRLLESWYVIIFFIFYEIKPSARFNWQNI